MFPDYKMEISSEGDSKDKGSRKEDKQMSKKTSDAQHSRQVPDLTSQGQRAVKKRGHLHQATVAEQINNNSDQPVHNDDSQKTTDDNRNDGKNSSAENDPKLQVTKVHSTQKDHKEDNIKSDRSKSSAEEEEEENDTENEVRVRQEHLEWDSKEDCTKSRTPKDTKENDLKDCAERGSRKYCAEKDGKDDCDEEEEDSKDHRESGSGDGDVDPLSVDLYDKLCAEKQAEEEAMMQWDTCFVGEDLKKACKKLSCSEKQFYTLLMSIFFIVTFAMVFGLFALQAQMSMTSKELITKVQGPKKPIPQGMYTLYFDYLESGVLPENVDMRANTTIFVH